MFVAKRGEDEEDLEKELDISTPTVVLRGVKNAENLANVIRENVEVVRWNKGVRVID